MGGMGPAAANAFGQKLIALNSGARSDQDHARVLLDQATDIPDRTAAILSGGTSPIERMAASLMRLDRGGADLVAVTCNTAHHFHADMQHTIDTFGLKLELLHIVDATLTDLDRQAPGAKKIGLLATSGTIDAGVYQGRAAELGRQVEWMVPSPATQADKVMAGIYQGVKAGRLDTGRAQLLAAAQELHAQGADAILLACTEIPLVLKTGDIRNKDGTHLPLIDTLGALAQDALQRAESTPSRRLVTAKGCFDVAAEGMSAFVQSAAALLHGTPERPRRIGVMGGMGPAAAMQFSDYMVRFNPTAQKDQDHVPLLLDQATDIPDRTGAILRGGRDPAPEMAASLHRLARAGADEVVMTCNTAHHFFPQIEDVIRREKLDVNMIHIVEATMKLLDQQAPNAKNIGLLATSGTVETGIYQNRAADRTWMLPDAHTQARHVMAGIYEDGVKAGKIDQGRDHLRQAAQALADQGADAILLACTEIPLVLKTGDIKNKAGEVVPLIDTLEAQAREAIARARVPVPATPGLLQQVSAWLAPRPPAPPEPAPA
jgi:aspartate racemase